MVDIHVGGSQLSKPVRHFHVRKLLLYSKIPFFDKMFNGRFKEAINQVAYLPEDCFSSFGVVIDWVYTDKLRSLEYLTIDGKIMGQNWHHINLFMLVDRLCLFTLRDALMDQYIETSKRETQLPSCNLFSS